MPSEDHTGLPEVIAEVAVDAGVVLQLVGLDELEGAATGSGVGGGALRTLAPSFQVRGPPRLLRADSDPSTGAGCERASGLPPALGTGSSLQAAHHLTHPQRYANSRATAGTERSGRCAPVSGTRRLQSQRLTAGLLQTLPIC